MQRPAVDRFRSLVPLADDCRVLDGRAEGHKPGQGGKVRPSPLAAETLEIAEP